MAVRRRLSAVTVQLCSQSPVASASIPAGSGSGADSTNLKAPPLGAAAKTIRLGIVGVGNMGGGHLSNIAAGDCPSVVVTALCDTDPARLATHEGKGYTLFTDSGANHKIALSPLSSGILSRFGMMSHLHNFQTNCCNRTSSMPCSLPPRITSTPQSELRPWRRDFTSWLRSQSRCTRRTVRSSSLRTTHFFV
jgi:hypothetical protein